MTDEAAENAATMALASVKQRMIFSECWDEGVRNVAAALKAAYAQGGVDALSFKTVDTDSINEGFAWPI